MLILILIDVQYSLKAVFSFEKRSNGQNHSSLCSLYPVEKSFPSKVSNSPATKLYSKLVWSMQHSIGKPVF